MQPVSVPEHFSKLMVWLSDGFSGSDLRAMAETVKRHIAMRGDLKSMTDETWWNALIAFAARSSGGGRDQRIRALQRDEKSIAGLLLRSEEPVFTQKEVGDLLNKDQGTISRWASKRRKNGKSGEELLNAQ
jgi:hypothetical protein